MKRILRKLNIVKTAKLVSRFEDKIFYGLDGCWYWTGAISKIGYAKISYDIANVFAHRLSYEMFKGDTNGLLVCHTCDNRSCVNPDHLFLGTQTNNMADMYSKGRGTTGSKHRLTKLSDENVLKVRELFAVDRIPSRDLAIKFGVSQSLICNIISGVKRTKI